MKEEPTQAPPPDWRKDTLECWQQLPNKTLFFALLAAWVLLFQFWGNSILGYVHTPSLFGWLDSLYNLNIEENDNSYGNLIPFLVIGIFWWKRKELLALPLNLWWPGLWLLAGALLLHILAYVVQQPFVSVVALFAGIFALMGLAWGPAWLRHSSYPFLLFIFSVPLASKLNFVLFPLRLLVVWLVEIVAHVIGIDVVRHGTELLDPSGKYGYDVVAACGGIHSLIAIFLLATVVAFGLLRRPGHRIFLMVMAVPFSVLGNMLRLLAIIIAAEMGGQKWGDWVHEGCPFYLPFHEHLPSFLHDPIAVVNLLPYIPGLVGLLWIAFKLEKREGRKQLLTQEPV